MNKPTHQSSLSQWIEWLLNLHANEIDLGIERVKKVALCMQINKPAPLVISVAGTNGKGSSVAIAVSILSAAGYQVGAYTSPHIERFNERIQVNGQCVSDKKIVDAFVRIEAARQGVKLTYFEFATLAALVIFKDMALDVVVLEVGLGGRLDAVNLVDADGALITAIDIDHIDWLGSDRSVIATEKAGIMRTGKLAVCSDPKPPESLALYAKKHDVALKQLNQDFSFTLNDQAWSFITADSFFDTKNYSESTLINLPMPALKGAFQLANAAGVVALLQLFGARLPVSEASIRLGLQRVKHPGRLQSLKVGQANWLIDVAHNPQSAQALAVFLANITDASVNDLTDTAVDASATHQAWLNSLNTLNSKMCSTQLSSAPHPAQRVAIFSVLADKDALPMIAVMAPHIQTWYVADLAIARASQTADIVNWLHQAGVDNKNIVTCTSISDAVKQVLSQNLSDVVVWGSFFTVSQTYAALRLLGKMDG
ncbi:bifunctional folylpolyglutamate synthase/dihydrofolate synthase [Thiomicrorhabdus aquaedulcis]|uniref:bifunctional folylpolyglutamate synthase/dihydrofolate synthase n=1 Tax=Thiomicrorhabdus aquaedulcis TaxID=2211106 RepID=UPI000FDB84B3|nr:folylpolyglutamate synthase/dihydrofolate synthase family protein [Thiomicrorhabdus aquaedulcis]